MGESDILVEELKENDVETVSTLIRKNMGEFNEAGNVLAATYRRVEELWQVYQARGTKYFVARDMHRGGFCIGGAGLGPLHGLDPAEGVGEVRDLVVETGVRGQGIGTRLLKRCLDEAKRLKYKRIYLETTPEMRIAQKLFLRFGFRPVTQTTTDAANAEAQSMPCYFVIESLEPSPEPPNLSN